MAAATDSLMETTPQEILHEVRSFLHGVTTQGHNLSRSETLAHSALVLLRTLPTARHAVLEYLANLFDEAVNGYLLELDIGHKVTDGGSLVTDRLLHDACGVLHTFIHAHSAAWAPIISSWSLELLGHISSKYSDRRGMPHTGSLNELLQLWMTCKPTKLLIEVATECFAQMVESAPETCVDALLEASVKYSPHFDWVVAHIGSCFPTSIITRVLMCGLKDYCHHGSRGDAAMDEKIPKMGSVVGILGHLASKHSQDIRAALMKLFQETLEVGSENLPHVTTIPFLLQLASMSPMLLHIMATDIVNALTAPVLNKLHVQFLPWMQSNPHEFDSMMTLVIHLVMQSDVGADKSLDFLLYNATVTSDDIDEYMPLPLPEIQKTCAILIDQILNETQTFLLRRSRTDSSLDIPYLGALSSKLPHLTRDMLHSEQRKSKWLRKLICYIIMYQGEKQGAETLALILSQAEDTQQLSNFLYIQKDTELAMPKVLDATAQRIIDLLEPHTDTNKLVLVKNLYQITEWERTNSKNLLIRSRFKDSLQPHWKTLSNLLLHSELEVALMVINILNYVPMPDTLSSGEMVQICGALVVLFFRVLEIEVKDKSSQAVHACNRCAKLLARRQYAQCILVQFLIEGAVSKENIALFGGKTDVGTSRTGTHDADTSLLHENKKHGLSLTIQRSHSSVFHAGVIGEGLRRGGKGHVYSQTIVKRNHQYLLEILWKCCQDNQDVPQTPMEGEEHHRASKNYSLAVSGDLSRMIGSLIVELTTPDVLYNNRFWPEEESLKMTVERDLQVWKMFDQNPVLWEVLEMLAPNSLIMSRCSVVLKSLTATLMHHFESSREKAAKNSPKQLECACHVIRCLAKSYLLPAPLSYLPELLALVTPHEVYLLLLAVWRYMKETPPTEDPEEVSRRVCSPKHIEVVRAIVHKNIETAGFLYARFFHTGQATATNLKSETQSVSEMS